MNSFKKMEDSSFSFSLIENADKHIYREWAKLIENFVVNLRRKITEIVAIMTLTLVSVFELQKDQLKNKLVSMIVVYNSMLIKVAKDKFIARRISGKYLKKFISFVDEIDLSNTKSETIEALGLNDSDFVFTKTYINWLKLIYNKLPGVILGTWGNTNDVCLEYCY
jgi:hypothetical protein